MPIANVLLQYEFGLLCYSTNKLSIYTSPVCIVCTVLDCCKVLGVRHSELFPLKIWTDILTQMQFVYSTLYGSWHNGFLKLLCICLLRAKSQTFYFRPPFVKKITPPWHLVHFWMQTDSFNYRYVVTHSGILIYIQLGTEINCTEPPPA